jgi:hypothetical protein
MNRFFEWCRNAKLVAAEIAGLVGFFLLLALGLWAEWHNLVALMRKLA